MLATLVAFFVLMTFGHGLSAEVVAVVGATLASLVARAVHPPASATALLIIQSNPPLRFIFVPVLTGVIALVLICILVNHFVLGSHYPRRWL